MYVIILYNARLQRHSTLSLLCFAQKKKKNREAEEKEEEEEEEAQGKRKNKRLLLSAFYYPLGKAEFAFRIIRAQKCIRYAISLQCYY